MSIVYIEKINYALQTSFLGPATLSSLSVAVRHKEEDVMYKCLNTHNFSFSPTLSTVDNR